jgi:hypothetical protein
VGKGMGIGKGEVRIYIDKHPAEKVSMKHLTVV